MGLVSERLDSCQGEIQLCLPFNSEGRSEKGGGPPDPLQRNSELHQRHGLTVIWVRNTRPDIPFDVCPPEFILIYFQKEFEEAYYFLRK